MKNLKATEKLMMLPLRKANPDYSAAYEMVYNDLRFDDLNKHTNHCAILNMLYEINKRRYTYVRIDYMVGLSDNALRRYRAIYIEMFKYYLNIVHSIKIAC